MLNLPLRTCLYSIATAVALSGCAATGLGKAEMNPAKEARIRVFNQNGIGVRLNPNRACYASETLFGLGDPAIQASSGGWSAMGSNRVVGMPRAADTPEKFHEYVVNANEPMTIETIYRLGGTATGSLRCGSLAGTFTPAPGADYEGYLYFEGQYCKLAIRQLVAAGDAVTTKPVRYTAAPKCGG